MNSIVGTSNIPVSSVTPVKITSSSLSVISYVTPGIMSPVNESIFFNNWHFFSGSFALRTTFVLPSTTALIISSEISYPYGAYISLK